jgi:hypothetical protein
MAAIQQMRLKLLEAFNAVPREGCHDQRVGVHSFE